MYSIKSNLQEKIAFLKLKSGDSDAFAFFYDKYVTRIYRFVYIRTSNQQTAEDLTQDIFLKVWQHLVDKRDIRSFQAFIFRIARNSIIDHYRLSNKQELPLDYVGDMVGSADDEEIKKLDKLIDADTLIREINKLKAQYQEVLALRYIEDLTIDEIAEVIQKDKRNVRVLIHRALNKLKEIVENK